MMSELMASYVRPHVHRNASYKHILSRTREDDTLDALPSVSLQLTRAIELPDQSGIELARTCLLIIYSREQVRQRLSLGDQKSHDGIEYA